MKSYYKHDHKRLASKSKLFLIFCVLLIAWLSDSKTAIAQRQKHGKITLKNGTKIKGYVIDSFKTEYIKIRVDTNQSMRIYYSRIHKITFKDKEGRRPLIENNEKLEQETVSLHDHKFYHELRGGVLLGEDNTSITLHNINGYQFSRFLAPGIGIGFDKYENYRTIPVYAHVKGYIFDRKITPYYFGDIGYGFAWYNGEHVTGYNISDVHGGLYWQVGLGYRISFYNSALLLTFAYKNQGAGLSYIYDTLQTGMYPASDQSIEISEQRTLRRVSICIGFSF